MSSFKQLRKVKVNPSPMDSELTKICTSCLKEKPLNEFWRRKNGKFGRDSKCAECKRKKEWEKSNFKGTPPIRVKPIDFDVNDNGCFICTSHGTKRGYPEIRRNKETKLISRFVYEECFGPIPEGLVIRHKCDNPFCINPEHLETGTQQENVKDMVDRNRQAKGQKNGNSKLTEREVVEIKMLLKQGIPDTEIAKKFPISRRTICSIKNGILWRHIDA